MMSMEQMFLKWDEVWQFCGSLYVAVFGSFGGSGFFNDPLELARNRVCFCMDPIEKEEREKNISGEVKVLHMWYKKVAFGAKISPRKCF